MRRGEVCFFHPAGRVLTSDWSVNSFIMIVYGSLALDGKF